MNLLSVRERVVSHLRGHHLRVQGSSSQGSSSQGSGVIISGFRGHLLQVRGHHPRVQGSSSQGDGDGDDGGDDDDDDDGDVFLPSLSSRVRLWFDSQFWRRLPHGDGQRVPRPDTAEWYHTHHTHTHTHTHMHTHTHTHTIKQVKADPLWSRL